jgi:Protein of unknown function (DUF3179)
VRALFVELVLALVVALAWPGGCGAAFAGDASSVPDAPPASDAASSADAPPALFKRYLPRGRIPSLDAPTFVPAAKASLPPDTWVLGVILKGEARAYELNLLTRHEVVNDRFGDQPVAAVWCPLANTAVIYDRRVGARELRFEPSGVLMGGAAVIQDKETDSYWPILQGKAAHGELKGSALSVLPVAAKALWKDWVREHPDTVVLSVGGREHLGRNPLEPYLASTYGFRGMVAADTRLVTKEPVFGFELDGKHYAVRAADLADGWAFRAGARHVFLYRPQDAALNVDTRAFVSDAGFARQGEAWVEKASGALFDPERGHFAGNGARALQGFDTFWYVWSLNYPSTDLLSR